MRRLLGGLVVGCLGLSLGRTVPAAEAADSCSLTGTYAVDGLGEAAGFVEAVGTLIFTPNPACTGGTVGGALTLRHQGQPPASVTPAGTYSVSSAGAVTLTLPGVIDLVGVLSLEGGGGTTANSLHLAAAFTAPQVFSVTGTRTPPLVGLQDLTCPPDAVRSGPTCIDTYEASVWEIPPGNAATIAKIKNGTVTLAELTAAGVQRGAASDDYGAGCPDSGNGCKTLYAVSIAGVTPSRFLTWFQAAAAARNAGKRLPTNAEWQAAALGTPDPGVSAAGSQDCNTANGGGAGVDAVVPTGSRSNCVSDVGAFDMVGNLWEWVADWVPLSTACVPALFAGDRNCLAGASTTAGPGALIRGGFGFDGGTGAGVFAVFGDNAPSSSEFGFGFRAAR
jgi:hypothetical protein